MRGKKTIINALMGILEELMAIISAFVLPRCIMETYGSSYNGLITSITLFLSCAVLLRCGIGGATRAALYKPLAEKNKEQINEIMKATDIFMKKIGIILAVAIVVLAAVYPLLVKNDFEWFFVFSLFLIIGASTFAESFFGITSLILLQADQRVWVSSLLRSVCYVLNVIVTVVLVSNSYSIHIVKAGSALVYVLYPIIIKNYVQKKYKINYDVKPNNSAISQRWDAFWHQLSLFAMDNTDIIVITVFCNVLEVSVYSVYSMIASGVKRAIVAFFNGLEAAFGNMFAKHENDVLAENLSIIETLIYGLATVVYTCAIVLVLGFVNVYTNGITDVNYQRPMFAYIFLVAQFFYCVQIPYSTVVQAVGHYKQTKYMAAIEPIINIVLSVVLVFHFGIVGVAIGTLVATIYKLVAFSCYMCKNVVFRKQYMTLTRCLVSFAEAIVAVVIIRYLDLNVPASYLEWGMNAIVSFIICCIVVGGGSLFFYRKDVIMLIKKIKGIIKVKSN